MSEKPKCRKRPKKPKIKPKSCNICNIIVINIDEHIQTKLSFRETLLISKCETVRKILREVSPDDWCDEGGKMGYLGEYGERSEDGDRYGQSITTYGDFKDPAYHSDYDDEEVCLAPIGQDAYCDLDINPDDYSDDEKLAQIKAKMEIREAERERKRKEELLASQSRGKDEDRDFYGLQKVTKDTVEEEEEPEQNYVRILKLEDCTTCGAYCANVEIVAEHMLLYLTTQFGVDGHPAGSTILSTSDLNFTLIEERKSEYIIRDNDLIEEKYIHIALDEDQYLILTGHRIGDDVYKNSGKLDMEAAKNLLFDGAGIIMMRYLAITNFKGSLVLSSMIYQGDVVKAIYKSRGYQKAWVNNTLRDVIQIEKTIIEECGIIERSLTVLTPTGHLIKHEWEGCQYIIHINPLCDVPALITGLASSWESDIQMLSNFLDYKEKRKASHKSYLSDKPEVRAIVADYIEYILLSKPSDILDYTIEYFTCLQSCNPAIKQSD